LSSKSKFVLYFTKVKDLEVPYLVYVPQKYNFKTPLKMIVYLHGGVVSLDKFNYDNFQIQQEPIFSVGEDLNAIVVYPFGKKDFGWVNQQKAFDNVFTVVDQVMKNFRIDKKNIILGGMSNGGTATFYYASQKPNVFKSFFAISSNPNVLLDRIKFSNLSQGKKIITLNSKDDNVYNFKEVENTYLKNKTIAKDWEFLSIEEGDHGFIYNPQKGKNILEEIIKKAFDN
jgi:predicted peptidase